MAGSGLTSAAPAVLSAPARLGAAVEAPLLHGDLSIVLTTLRPAKVRSLQEQLPGLTGGEGVLETGFGGYQPVRGRRAAAYGCRAEAERTQLDGAGLSSTRSSSGVR